MRNRPAFLGTLVAIVLCCSLQPICAAEFSPATFQGPDGALVLNPGGNYVEPYFATKALLVAQDQGLDIHAAAMAWIQWCLPRQRPDGLFRRFCQKNGEWRDCAPADADDSMLALWMQLIYRMAPADGMPAAWQRSALLCSKQLEKLRNRRLDVYHVSKWNHVALLMDNVEVYSALKDVAEAEKRLHDPAAPETAARAEQLRAAIERVFWDGRAKRYRPSMQKTPPTFYPDAVAQVYPWLADLNGRGQDARRAWEQWKRKFGTGWLERRYDTHPWGLVALAADKLGDTPSAACWVSRAEPLRGSNSWNVLEEAAWQSLHAQFSSSQLLDPNACSAVLSQ
ncbi:MAG TPA: hypothetical protein VJO35_15945 [Terriglobales bacterium]|nr:hypothetical protein [Terriglobales bacterium]